MANFQHHSHSLKHRGWTLSLPVLWLSLLVAPLGYSQPSFAQLVDEEVARIEAGAAAQQEVDKLDEQRASLANDYRAVLKQQANMKTYNRQLQATVRSQEEEMASLRTQIGQVGDLERNVVPLMVDMLDALEEFVALDTPFLLPERRRRIENLRQLMGQEGIANSEKYRRILEAYQIENDYGRSLEAYSGNLNTVASGSDQEVVFLKLGRVSLIYQTLDGEESNLWNASTESWQALNSQQNKQVSQAIKMAREQIPSNLVQLPVAVYAAK